MEASTEPTLTWDELACGICGAIHFEDPEGCPMVPDDERLGLDADDYDQGGS